MRLSLLLSVIVCSTIVVLFSNFRTGSSVQITTDTLLYPEERHFKNIQQLTFGGDNAEAYFSYDGKWLIFQKTYAKEGIPCDQMYIGNHDW